jgi:diguanylate cyclase (GGDEF)-like protein
MNKPQSITAKSHLVDQKNNIARIMSKKIVSVRGDQSALYVARKLRSNKVGAVLVLDKNGHLEGVISERDIISKVIGAGKDPARASAASIMSKKVFSAKPEHSVNRVLNQMQTKHVRHIPVTDKEGRALGVVSLRDLLTQNQKEMRRLLRMKDQTLTVDALTGLKNYRFFNDYLDAEITRSQLHESCFSLIFMDLDHFKELNDSEGHPMGNLVLMRFGEILNPKNGGSAEVSLRRTDTAIRLGGDEFALILSDTAVQGAHICADRVLRTVRSRLNDIPGIEPKTPLTVSIGIATFPNDAKDRESLIKHSDLALYEAKRRGKDQIYVYTPDLHEKDNSKAGGTYRS